METTTTPMSKEEIVENLKTMVFGKQAFERFNAKERETLDKAWNIIDQYENRLKADLKAILVELQLEIEEIRTEEPINNGHGICGWEGKWAEDIIQECSKIIQEKINALKENKNESY